MRRLWTRREGLALALCLAAFPVPAAPPVHRIVAVGDLHGDFGAWRRIALAAGLVDGDGGWSGGSTVLVQTGDVTDRGPDARRIIQDLMRLQREAERAGGRVIALVGNHEAMNIEGDWRYVSAADYASWADSNSEQVRARTFAANRAAITAAYRGRDPAMSDEAVRKAWFDATPPGSLERRVAWEPDGEIGRWIAANPVIALVDGNLFVHGGISPAYAHMGIEQINRQARAALLAKSTDPRAIINDPVGPLWYRGLATPNADADAGQAATAPPEPPVEEQLDSLLPAFGARRIVIGHTPILTGIAMLFGGRLIRIDTGIPSVFNGKLSYLDILDGNPVPHLVERS